MKKIFLFILTIFITVASGQNKISANHSLMNLTCKTCHSCDVPTKKDPCLIPCPRADMITVNQTPSQAPEVEVLKELSNKYLPVVFSHKIHAEMAEMAGGCKTCHHYNTVGPIQPCINCHETSRKRDDISKPDLEAAYHRQCITCHREWSHSNNCTSCHALKNASNTSLVSSNVKKISGKTHPKLEEPSKIVYETNYSKGKFVTFFHDEHIKTFGASCVNCHQQDNCTKCHDRDKTNLVQKISDGMPIKIQKSKAEHHKPCFSCHQNDSCSLCHKDKESGPFNHLEVTGWALNRFHEKLSCEKCHGTSKKFVKLNNDCISCHTNFAPGKFDHKITGLKLDENHSELDCKECHQEKTFAKPVCTNCHDDKSFPKNKPGKLTPVSLGKKPGAAKK